MFRNPKDWRQMREGTTRGTICTANSSLRVLCFSCVPALPWFVLSGIRLLATTTRSDMFKRASAPREGCTAVCDFSFRRVKPGYVSKIIVAFWISVSVPMGNGQADQINQLIANLLDPSWQVRQNAASELGKIGAPAIKPLITALKDSRNDL